MIRNAGYAMEQFCRRCAAKGNPPEECWWPITDEFWKRKPDDGTHVVQWYRECKACRAERDAEIYSRRKAERMAA